MCLTFWSFIYPFEFYIPLFGPFDRPYLCLHVHAPLYGFSAYVYVHPVMGFLAVSKTSEALWGFHTLSWWVTQFGIFSSFRFGDHSRRLDHYRVSFDRLSIYLSIWDLSSSFHSAYLLKYSIYLFIVYFYVFRLIDWLIDWFDHLFIYLLIICLFILIYSFIHLFSYWLICWLFIIYRLMIDWLTDWFWLIPLFTYLLLYLSDLFIYLF